MRRRPCGVLLAVVVAGLVTVPAVPAGAVAYGRVLADPVGGAPWVLPLSSSADGYAPTATTCTATALGPQLLVTSAGCVSRRTFYSVEVGAARLGGGRQVPVEAVLLNPHYRPATHLHDLALLRPLRPLGLSAYARLAPRPLTDRLATSHAPALALYGWGRSQDGKPAARLRQAVVRQQPAAAAHAFGGTFRPGPMLAVGLARPAVHGFARACSGDEGGPLVVRDHGVPYVVGITSFSAARCRAAKPSLVSAVAAHRGWLGTAASALPARARTDNRAKPEWLTEPTITGATAVGSTLTCTPGIWTANLTGVTYRWTVLRPGTAQGSSTGSQYTLTQADTASRVYCLVDGASQAGTATAMAALSTPGAPTRTLPSPLPTMSLRAFDPLPVPGTVVTCTPPTYREPGVTTSTRWSVVDGASVQPVGDGSSLTLTEELLRSVAGRVLRCQTTSSIGGFSPDVAVVDRTIAALAPPVATGVWISPDLGVEQPYDGMPLHCDSSVIDGPAESVTYTWAMQSTDPADSGDAATLAPDARVLGTGPDYVMTADDVTAFQTEYLVCRVTASSWQGTDSWWDWY